MAPLRMLVKEALMFRIYIRSTPRCFASEEALSVIGGIKWHEGNETLEETLRSREIELTEERSIVTNRQWRSTYLIWEVSHRRNLGEIDRLDHRAKPPCQRYALHLACNFAYDDWKRNVLTWKSYQRGLASTVGWESRTTNRLISLLQSATQNFQEKAKK